MLNIFRLPYFGTFLSPLPVSKFNLHSFTKLCHCVRLYGTPRPRPTADVIEMLTFNK